MRELALGYELVNVVPFEYSVDSVPDDEQLHADVVFMARLLGRLAVAETAQSVPGERAPEVLEVIEAIELAAGRTSRARRQGYRLSQAERIAVERRAVNVAVAMYERNGWEVSDVGATKSYDLHCTRTDEVLRVEVKGTTSTGAEVILTRNEVAEHRQAHPANALVVVHSIELDRSSEAPIAAGGTIAEWCPWEISDDSLTVLSYSYRTGL